MFLSSNHDESQIKVNRVAYDSDRDIRKRDQLVKKATYLQILAAARGHMEGGTHSNKTGVHQYMSGIGPDMLSLLPDEMKSIDLCPFFLYDEQADILVCEIKRIVELASTNAHVGPQSSSHKWTPLNRHKCMAR